MMAAGRSLRNIMGRRRRAEEEGEDEEGDVVVEDSQSEASILSDAEDDEADVSSLGGPDALGEGDDAVKEKSEAAAGSKSTGKKARKSRKKVSRKATRETTSDASPQAQSGAFKTMADTAAMMNGLQIDTEAMQTVVDFEAVEAERDAHTIAASPTQPVIAISSNGNSQSPAERQRREHEEYRKKRDTNPAFIPNRGNFFMHDTRSHLGQSGPAMRGNWSGRGRGRGGQLGSNGGPFSQASQAQPAERAAEQTWKHDLHDTINEEPLASPAARLVDVQDGRDDSARLFPKTSGPQQSQQRPQSLSFSSTTLVGKVQIRVFLSGMKAPITFSEVPWKQYIRLPDHRPPLRRDKPVRVFVPGHTQRYIFPSSDRSFIFIPRQMRPNQQGFGRTAYQRSIGGYGYSSRRTSMYGGSMYAASVAASRRSSFASVARETAFSPVGSYIGGMPPTRPMVRLPPGHQGHWSASSTPMGPLSGHQTPTGMQVHTFPLPQAPTFQGTPTTTVHQPRPQKAISVTGIESPAALQQAPAPSDFQPFQNQLPAHMNEHATFQQQPQQPYFSPHQNFAYAHPQAGTPLSGIPEQAIHAPAFQPPMMPYNGAPYFGQYQPPQNFFYPPSANGYPQMPMYAPPPQAFTMPPPAPLQHGAPQPIVQPQMQQPAQSVESEEGSSQQQSQSQSGMMAHESNGMVFYLPASEAQQQPQGDNNYQPAESFVPSYAMPGLPPPTPAPETSYYYQPQMPGYYASQQQQ